MIGDITRYSFCFCVGVLCSYFIVNTDISKYVNKDILRNKQPVYMRGTFCVYSCVRIVSK